jgi:RNA polymerase sigma-70 factor (ECF subfamily)
VTPSARLAALGHALSPAAALALDEAVAAARAAWPGIALDDAALVAHVARHAADDGDRVATRNLADLYLACACLHGVPAAVRQFEALHLQRVPRVIGRVVREPSAVEDVQQLLRVSLLVGDGVAPPRIGQYAGRGPLGAWVNVSAVRAALMYKRKRYDQVNASQDLAQRPMPLEDISPETALLRARYQVEYQEALMDALAGLEPRERNLLRLYFVDGYTIDKLAARFRVHRATAARRVEAARRLLLERTRAGLAARLGATDSEFESLLAVVRDDLHLSMSVAFGLRDQ